MQVQGLNLHLLHSQVNYLPLSYLGSLIHVCNFTKKQKVKDKIMKNHRFVNMLCLE